MEEKLPYPQEQPSHFCQQQQQSSNTNVTVVPQPPQPAFVARPRRRSNDQRVLIFAVTTAIAMGILFFPVLACVLPGLILALVARHHELSGEKDSATAKSMRGISICCNVTGLIFYAVSVLILLIFSLYAAILIYAIRLIYI